MNLKGFIQRILIGLDGFDLSEMIFDVDKVIVLEDRQRQNLVVLSEAVAAKGSWKVSHRLYLHLCKKIYLVEIIL